MKILNQFLQMKFLILMFYLTSCSTSIQQAEPTSLTPTTIKLVSSPSQNSSSPSNITPQPTIKGLPTLALNRQAQLYELFKNNGNCELPCFLGITPGKTSWQDTKSFFDPFILRPFRDTPNLRLFWADIVTNHEVTLYGNLELYVAPDWLLKHIIFSAEFTQKGITETHDKHLIWYSISEIFKRYGPPDEIYLNISNRNLVYSINMVYESKKLVLGYTGLANQNNDGNYSTLCPNLGDGDISAMGLRVLSPSDPTDVKSLGEYPFWDVPPFEEVSGMSRNDFYKIMTRNLQPACIQIPLPQ
jgi:hypothetical protein